MRPSAPIAMAPTAWLGSESPTLVQWSPASVVFQTPPPAAPR
jgi:hypothetical protein